MLPELEICYCGMHRPTAKHVAAQAEIQCTAVVWCPCHCLVPVSWGSWSKKSWCPWNERPKSLLAATRSIACASEIKHKRKGVCPLAAMCSLAPLWFLHPHHMNGSACFRRCPRAVRSKMWFEASLFLWDPKPACHLGCSAGPLYCMGAWPFILHFYLWEIW